MLRETSSTDGGSLSEVLKIPSEMITCWGFGSPPCVNHHLAITSPFINNVVLQVSHLSWMFSLQCCLNLYFARIYGLCFYLLQDDVVARVSPGALEDLRSEIAQTEWYDPFLMMMSREYSSCDAIVK